MRNVHRIVATGALVGMGAAGATASGAFACSAFARIAVVVAGTKNPPATVLPGDALTVTGQDFNPGGTFDLTWSDPDGTEVPLPVTITASSSTGFEAQMKVPESARASAPDSRPYSVVATQRDIGGSTIGRASSALYIGGYVASTTPTTAGSPAPTGGGGGVVSPQPGPVADPAPVTNRPAPVGGVAPGPARPATTPASPRGSSAARPGTAPAAAVPPAAGQPNVVAPVAATPRPDATVAPAPVAAPAPPDVAAQPSSDDLWSGLSSSGRVPSLVDPAAPASLSGGLPVGGALFVGGLLALAGTALATTRRRLAPSRRAR